MPDDPIPERKNFTMFGPQAVGPSWGPTHGGTYYKGGLKFNDIQNDLMWRVRCNKELKVNDKPFPAEVQAAKTMPQPKSWSSKRHHIMRDPALRNALTKAKQIADRIEREHNPNHSPPAVHPPHRSAAPPGLPTASRTATRFPLIPSAAPSEASGVVAYKTWLSGDPHPPPRPPLFQGTVPRGQRFRQGRAGQPNPEMQGRHGGRAPQPPMTERSGREISALIRYAQDLVQVTRSVTHRG